MLCFLLSLFSFAAFVYVTAALAGYFDGRDAENENAELVSAKPIKELHGEIAALHVTCNEKEPCGPGVKEAIGLRGKWKEPDTKREQRLVQRRDFL